MYKLVKKIPYYIKKPLTILYKETPYYVKKTSYHISETNPLLYKETPDYVRKAFPYYRRKSLTNKENIQEHPLL